MKIETVIQVAVIRSIDALDGDRIEDAARDALVDVTWRKVSRFIQPAIDCCGQDERFGVVLSEALRMWLEAQPRVHRALCAAGEEHAVVEVTL